MLKRILPLFLILALMLVGCTGAAPEQNTQPSSEADIVLATEPAESTAPAPTQETIPQETPAPETMESLPAEETEPATEQEPVTADTTPQETKPVETEPKATEPKPTEPKPTEPKPTEPKPTEPKPTEPKPTEPKPTEPKPTEPKPTEPKPTEPKPTEPKPTEHTHSYQKRVTAPTCTADGYTTYTCSCGDSYTSDAVSAKGHSFGDWVTVREATQSQEGQQTRTCGSCGATESRSIDKLPSSGVTEADIPTLEGYARSYAASVGFTVDKSLGYNAVCGYFPAVSISTASIDAAKAGIRESIDGLKQDLTIAAGSINGARYNNVIYFSGSTLYTQDFYG